MPSLHFPRFPDRTLLRMLLLSLSLHLALLMIVQPTRLREATVTPPITARLEQPLPAPVPPVPERVPAASPPVADRPRPAEKMPQPAPETSKPQAQPVTQEMEAVPVPATVTPPVPAPAVAASAAPTPLPTAALPRSPVRAEAIAPVAPPAASPPALPSVPVMQDTNWYSARQLDLQPRQLRPVQPVYPPQARRRGVEGAVKLMLKIDEYGVVQAIQVEEGDPPGVFDAAALEAFRTARFSPAKINQRPVRAQVYVRVVFRLE